ncbi:TetR family transcriptional regulator [Actinosynnema pretiosum subsp. pretiosum]|uniref:TetR family transcriptional regulator n=1 Tax=Actinosynnema pretiosum subsp. pretiosum TaxID=103721 RepID=A0AA45L899_9PSEU|nr:TetR family transcriptional regulator [Actinosynnema pretiosum subsp. pretiosum]
MGTFLPASGTFVHCARLTISGEAGVDEDDAGTGARTPARGAGSRRPDPGRRDRIIDACLDVIAEVGVDGASHRGIAAAAGVPLGSMTYHFDGMRQLLREAFGRFAGAVAAGFEARMAAAANAEEAAAAVVEIITVDTLSTQRDLVLTHELYTLAARDPECRDVTNAWMAASRRALERHFDPLTARLLDALIEGMSIHRALDTEPHDRAAAVAAVERITGRTSGGTAG